jgi:hypothetical protein
LREKITLKKIAPKETPQKRNNTRKDSAGKK